MYFLNNFNIHYKSNFILSHEIKFECVLDCNLNYECQKTSQEISIPLFFDFELRKNSLIFLIYHYKMFQKTSKIFFINIVSYVIVMNLRAINLPI